jgi:predicted protein tyrosine phosphatase
MIKIFSRDEMIDYVMSYGVSPDEYYISILPTGGPKGIPIFENNLPNVITLVFDDVTKDCIKTQYPDGIGLRYAKAMTENQADLLVSFIRKVPNNATINIHCVQGHSRSMGIKRAILNEEPKGNKHVYSLIKERLHK